MSLKKRILSIIMAVACASTLSSVAVSAESAESNVPVDFYSMSSEFADSENTTRDNNIPTATWNLSTNGDYTINGSASGSAVLYTSYIFKSNSGELNYTIYNNNNSQSITVYMYKNGKTIFHRKKLGTISAGGSLSDSISFSSSDTAFFAFTSPCNVTGTITD